MSNPMLSSWYPTDPFLFIMEMQMQSAFSRRGSSVISKYIGRNDPKDLPDLPPAFPNGCTDTLYRPGVFGSPQGVDRFCRLLYSNPKPWNPNDPCLAAAAKEYWSGVDKINKYYQDAHGLNARRLNIQLLRIEAERVACRAGCDFSWGACEAECDEKAETLKRNWNRAYQDEEERLDQEQSNIWTNLERAFWAAAIVCGYSIGSLGIGRGWGGPVPILREEVQA